MPFPAPGYLPIPEIKPMAPESPASTGGFSTTAPPGKPGSDSTLNSGRGQLRLGVQGLYTGLQAPFIPGSFTLFSPAPSTCHALSGLPAFPHAIPLARNAFFTFIASFGCLLLESHPDLSGRGRHSLLWGPVALCLSSPFGQHKD